MKITVCEFPNEATRAKYYLPDEPDGWEAIWFARSVTATLPPST